MRKQVCHLSGEQSFIRRFPAVLGRAEMSRAVQSARSQVLTQSFGLLDAVARHGSVTAAVTFDRERIAADADVESSPTVR